MPKCILIIEDDPVNRELAKRTLQSKGYDVITAGDGVEGLEVLQKKHRMLFC